MHSVNQHNLLQYLLALTVNDNCNGHKDYYEWANETEELKNDLVQIGEIDLVPAEKQFEGPYWGVDTPMKMNKYPYYGCDLFQCKKCQTVFFYYLELGGHAPQKRYRVVRRELIEI